MNLGINKFIWHLFHKYDYGIAGKNHSTREEWVKNTLLNLKEGHKILDAGAGELPYKKYCEHLEYKSQDFGKYDGKGNNIGKQTGTWDNTRLDIVSDIADIPEPDESYDVVLCTEVFQHIPEPIKAMEEFSRLLRKSGTLILTVPVASMTHFAPFYYYNGYSRYFFEKYLPLFGFTINEITYNGNYFEHLAQSFRSVVKFSYKYSTISKFEALFFALITPIVLKRLVKFSENDKGSRELISGGMRRSQCLGQNRN